MTAAKSKRPAASQAKGKGKAPAEEQAPKAAVAVPRQNKGKAGEPEPAKVIDPGTLFPAIERIRQSRDVDGTQLKRILWANDQGRLAPTVDGRPGLSLEARILAVIDTALPAVENAVADPSVLPTFMQVRDEFSLKLPDSLGGGTLSFKKRPMYAIFQGESAWISENVLWLPKSEVGPKARLMIHAILNWKLKAPPESEPDPHITLRDAETQAKIDLDTMEPLMSGRPAGSAPVKPRITKKMEATRTSFSRGLGQERSVGAAVGLPDTAKLTLESDEIKTWLKALTKVAQDNLLQQPQ